MISDFKEDVFNFPNSNGEMIHAVYNYIHKDCPLVIISPPFEKDIRTMLMLMIYLVNNGFNVFRYDNTYHRGNSYGDFKEWSVVKGLVDIASVIDFVKDEKTIGTTGGISFIGMSISARTAYRYFAENHGSVDLLLSVVGVVNLQYTLKAILDFDIIQAFIDSPGKKWGINKIIHYPICWDICINALLETNMHDQANTIIDIERITTPMSLIVAEDDKWVDINSYEVVFKNASSNLRHVFKIPGAGHELYKNPQAAEHAFFGTLKILTDFYYNRILHENSAVIPNISEIIELNKKERSREAKYSYLKNERCSLTAC